MGLQLVTFLVLPSLIAAVLGAILILYTLTPFILINLGLKENPHLKDVAQGKTAAYLDFASTKHLGKQPGASVEDPNASEWDPTPEPEKPKLAVLLVGSRCDGPLGPFDKDYIFIRKMFAEMLNELQTAKPEEDVGYLNSELFLQSERPQNNVSMAVIYFRSYEHVRRFAHKEDIVHWQAWMRFRRMQREDYATSTKIGLWHETYEVSNAEAIYHNMRPFGLGNLWDHVAAPTTKEGQGGAVQSKAVGKYRSSLVSADGKFFTSNGRMKLSDGKDWSEEEFHEKYDKEGSV
ncbi:hypothetical protein SISSUDRAFT_1054581 [Sistotremastrum suecicum HHB10207 ss-3]|uniref:Uncharacterized protein n=1 Tax=Sistotremastrum suecicum HHB10207 ss-3 TaxID=1314776 RepID=A0A165YE43_9AGAM|nr:hypothetical protein SISSUDRAFT_1054581 [Sistotremastrum suecicum HHB10207 ss-3]